jgi:hypothetical protein
MRQRDALERIRGRHSHFSAATGGICVSEWRFPERFPLGSSSRLLESERLVIRGIRKILFPQLNRTASYRYPDVPCQEDYVGDLRGRNVNVLWLSESVFISKFLFRLGTNGLIPGIDLPDYEVAIMDRERMRYISWAVALSSLESDDRGEPSALPLEFVQHITRLSAADLFAEISLQRTSLLIARWTT